MRLRPASVEERQLAALWGVAAAGALALRPFWLVLAPTMQACPLRTLTGIPCPTCGTTRAAVAFLHGDLLGAFVWNPLAAVAAVAFFAGGGLAVVWALGRLPMPVVPRPPAWAVRLVVGLSLAGTWTWVALTQ